MRPTSASELRELRDQVAESMADAAVPGLVALVDRLVRLAKPIVRAGRVVSYDGFATLTVTEAELVELEAAIHRVEGRTLCEDEEQ